MKTKVFPFVVPVRRLLLSWLSCDLWVQITTPWTKLQTPFESAEIISQKLQPYLLRLRPRSRHDVRLQNTYTCLQYNLVTLNIVQPPIYTYMIWYNPHLSLQSINISLLGLLSPFSSLHDYFPWKISERRSAEVKLGSFAELGDCYSSSS